MIIQVDAGLCNEQNQFSVIQCFCVLRHEMFCLFYVFFFYLFFLHFQVDSSYDSGDYENAKKYSNIAKCLSLTSIILGVFLIFILTVVMQVGSRFTAVVSKRAPFL